MKRLFEYEDYRAYLSDLFEERSHGKKTGERVRFASAIKCHAAYVSQILGGKADLSPEQADFAARYLGLGEVEAEYFLMLVLYSRAGTAHLKSYYLKKVRSISNDQSLLKKRLQFTAVLPSEHQPTYYSAWYYTAIHLLLAVPRMQKKEALSAYLGLPLPVVSRTLAFLVEHGLASEEKGRFVVGKVSLHLPNDSPLVSKHHANWRMKAIQALDHPGEGDLHYSSVVSMSKTEALQIRELMIETIRRIRETVRTAPDEDLYAYSMDLFALSDEVGA